MNPITLERQPFVEPSSHDLELVVASSLFSGKVAASKRGIAQTFSDLVIALTKSKVDYVLAGAMAFGLYGPARYTKDIDILSLEGSRKKLIEALSKAGFHLSQELPYQLTFVDPTNNVEVDVLLGEVDPEESAVEDPGKATVFGVPTLVIKPEYLLWMYCLSDLPKHEVDAIALIKSGKVDIPLFKRFLEYASDSAAEEQYRYIMDKLGKTAGSSYSDQVAARVAKSRKS